jgi:hypothetical protein
MLKTLTFVISAENHPDLLARTVMLFHRLAIGSCADHAARRRFTLAHPRGSSRRPSAIGPHRREPGQIGSRPRGRNAQTSTQARSHHAIPRGATLMNVIYLITTGGTIEKVHSEQTGAACFSSFV